MKRMILFGLSLALLVSCLGCNRPQTQEEGVKFYYCVADPVCSEENGVIASEPRGGIEDRTLLFILEFYLAGPQSADLRSPFPEGLQVISAQLQDQTLCLTVSGELCALSGLELTLACGCLTLTCLDLTEATRVQITSEFGLLDGQESITMDKNALLLQIGNPEGE